jgi:nucleotide-binding universal stress UspA family protein
MSIFPTKILLATDGSKDAELAARTATELTDKTGSELHVVHVFGITPWYPVYPDITDFYETELEDPVLEEDLQRISEKRARKLLDAEVEKIRSVGGAPVQARLAEGEAPQEIIGLAEEIGAGLIVVGSRGRGRIRRALMGSVSDSVVRHAHCPVMVVRGDEGEANVLPGKILLALDGSEEASVAARTAVDLTERMDSELHVVHVGVVAPVYHPERHGYLARYEELQEEAQRLLDEQVDKVKSAGGTVVEAHLRMGRADEEIVVLGEEIEAGLIVTGSRGLGGIRRALMGSVSESVVHHASCPVLIVRKEE